MMRRKWATFRRLSPAERRTFFQAAALLPLSVVGLKVVGFRRWQGALARLEPAQPPRADTRAVERVRATARMVELAASRGLSNPTCLPRALVLRLLLRRQGLDARVRIGVRKQGDGLDAHAWVEYQGIVVNDGADVGARFAAFDALNASRQPS